jgi:hypothetical protein
MRFKSDDDKVLFLAEINRLDLVGKEIPICEFETFIKKRKSIIGNFKDFKKSQRAKHAWKKRRWKYMQGIKKFNRSMQGKRQHRAMARFLATTMFKPKMREAFDLIKYSTLKAVSSLKTHMYIEQEYYSGVNDEVDFLLFLEYALPLLNSVENKLTVEHEEPLNKDEVELLYRLTNSVKLTEILEAEFGITIKEKLEEYKSRKGADPDETYFNINMFRELLQ